MSSVNRTGKGLKILIVTVVPLSSSTKISLWAQKHTCLAIFPALLTSFPVTSNSSIVPIGTWSCIAVTIVTDSESVHSDDGASPRKPKVHRDVRSTSEVWCFRAISIPMRLWRRTEGWLY